ncbi:MAG TPA: pilus assembly protein TadG-related protein, partial [Pseudolabrys sp.]|nr:pilus assembly protein TadG-related protein [Pseudolabrys sp.]
MLARFLSNVRGSVAPLLGLVALPLMTAVGMAVDYSRANADRAAFQVALDSTALMLSKTAATDSNADLQTQATETFNSLFNRPGVTNIQVTPTYTADGGSKLVLSGSAVVNTSFLGLIGVSAINISSESTSTWGNTRLRVALVLDNTGSMNDAGKIGALKTAAQ